MLLNESSTVVSSTPASTLLRDSHRMAARLRQRLVDAVHAMENQRNDDRALPLSLRVRTPRFDYGTLRDLRESVRRLAWIESVLLANVELGPS